MHLPASFVFTWQRDMLENWSDRNHEPMGNRHMSLVIFLDSPTDTGDKVFPTQYVQVGIISWAQY